MKTELLYQIFTSDSPLLDVRAPLEFQQGAFPTATNIPILTNEEREEVGICYKKHGSEKATRLGHQLVSGKVRETRLAAWLAFLTENPSAYLYCFRGGQRSQLAQEWLASAGVKVVKIEGGYKCLRNFLLSVFEQLPQINVVSGKTGVGKTEFLNQMPATLDLEGHARHRGSAFGGKTIAQPTQIDFENAIAIDLLKLSGPIYLEDEGRLIGRVCLPLALQNAMKDAPIILLEDTIDNRVERIFREYVIEQLAEFSKETSIAPLERLQNKYVGALNAIKKRLGGVAFADILKKMLYAFEMHHKGRSAEHKKWIEPLLTQYYDPMYSYQLEKKQDRIIMRGDRETLRAYILAKPLVAKV